MIPGHFNRGSKVGPSHLIPHFTTTIKEIIIYPCYQCCYYMYCNVWYCSVTMQHFSAHQVVSHVTSATDSLSEPNLCSLSKIFFFFFSKKIFNIKVYLLPHDLSIFHSVAKLT